ncbi:cutinase family protein [Microbacterium sp. Clip185]|uniref:cutinase family protein n=1 Tax=Microbacterium sp. Clip185 TaxID=3025663 RepID=UPI0023663FF3|nr:cutinase family protein [Microbacterium sp. Clip185]WDG18078.1 cutinase family protein [Microbacterium sp. Clip185]
MPKKNTPPRRGLRALLAAPLIAALIVGGTLGSASAASAAQPSGVCAGANVFIGVRGTNAPGGSNPSTTGNAWQSGGMGDQVQGLANHFKYDAPYSSAWPTYVESLNYPASTDLIGSIAAGVQTLRAELNYIGSLCGVFTPNIILAGHSQGAAVISGVLKNPGLLNQRAKQAIRAVALLGDPYHSANMPYSMLNNSNYGTLAMTAGEYNTIYENFRFWGWAQYSENIGWVSKVRDYCFTGDAACTGNLTDSGWQIHNAYTALTSQITSWMDYMLTNTE